MQTNSPPDRTEVPASNSPGMVNSEPPGMDGLTGQFAEAAKAGLPQTANDDAPELGPKMLKLIQAAESSSERYMNFVQKSWERAYKSFRNEHFDGSKYNSKDYAARSKLFRPKTRSAVRKAMASTAASLFSTVDAIAISAGNDCDPACRANAALVQEIVNYRTARTSGRNAIPWFKTAMGATMNATMTGVVISKQYWKLETKVTGHQPRMMAHPETGEPAEVWEQDEDGNETQVMDPITKVVFDRPDIIICPSENIIIDAGCDWVDPAQTSAFLILKWPMKIDEIRQREKDPRDPWHHLEESQLFAGKTDRGGARQQSIRAAREGGTDRFDQTNNASDYSTVWVYECYVRYQGEDYTFFSITGNHLLTDPRPVEEIYPWNDGERPITFGYGALEAHRIFPMSPAESWQPLQSEINDLANLTLDGVKMNIAPVAKVKRGRQVDLDALKRRGPGTNLLMQDVDDVEFDKPPGVDAGAWQQQERLTVDFDDLAGQFNSGSVQTNRNLNETVGGMKLIAGASNALQEFDQRVFIESWAEPALGQVVKLCQYYEHDQTILELCGDRAQLWEKYGVSQITDDLLDKQISIQIDVGLGTGDPQQRLQKFQMAASIAFALLKDSPEVQSGQKSLDIDAIMQECFGGAGYRDGGKRFIKSNPPKDPNADPHAQAALDAAKAKTFKDQAQGKSALLVGLAAVAKVGIGDRQAEADTTNNQLDHERQMADLHMKAVDMGHRHGIEMANGLQPPAGAEGAAPGQPKPAAQPQAQPQVAPQQGGGDPQDEILRQIAAHLSRPRTKHFQFHRGADGRIAGATATDGHPAPAAAH